MRALIQRVACASVSVDANLISSINQGLLVFVGVHKDDTEKEAKMVASKVAHIRLFRDENDKMNKSVKDLSLPLLVVSQFTLYANTSGGRRPDFLLAKEPVAAEALFELFVSFLINEHALEVKKGAFGKKMQVSLTNDGPVTIMVEELHTVIS